MLVPRRHLHWIFSAPIIGDWTGSFATTKLGPPPEWVRGLRSLVRRSRAWQEISVMGPQGLLQKARPYAGPFLQWAVSAAGGIGATFLQFLLTTVLSAVLYAKGELAASAALRFGARLAGARGEQSVRLAARPIRGVALGVVVTALIQASIGGVGLALAEVPFAPLLSAVLFILCIAQIGPGPILVRPSSGCLRRIESAPELSSP